MMKQDSISADLVNTTFTKDKPRVFGRNKIVVKLNREDLSWTCDYFGKKIYGQVAEETVTDLSNLGVILPPDDEKFYDSLELYLTRAVVEFIARKGVTDDVQI